MQRIIRYILIATFLFSVAAFSGNKVVNFSGEWTLNEGKSKLGEGRRWGVSTKVSINQNENQLTIKRTSPGRDGDERIREETLTLDGKECKSTVRDFPRISTATWSNDGKILTITSKMIFERNGNEFKINTTEVWNLKEKVKVLSIDYSSKSQRGERKSTRVYDRTKSPE